MNFHPYFGAKALLSTKHQKGKIIAPHFSEFLSMSIEEVYVDTDQLGTFSGEIERTGTAREVAIRKARLGIEESTCSLGIASEGTIGADPFIPFFNSDIEVLAFVDAELGIEIVESYRSYEIVALTRTVSSTDDLDEILVKADFPNHKLIVRTESKPINFCLKGITERHILIAAVEEGIRSDPFKRVVIESDLRAHCSPSRQKNIAETARKLAERISNQCPECSTPGWGIVTYLKGLPCQSCGEISTEAFKTEIYGCVKCAHQSEGKMLAASIDPSRCNWCNP